MHTLDTINLNFLDYYPKEFIRLFIPSAIFCRLSFKNSSYISKDHNDLSKKGVKFLSEPVLETEGIAKVCFCMDPSNTRIELVEMI